MRAICAPRRTGAEAPPPRVGFDLAHPMEPGHIAAEGCDMRPPEMPCQVGSSSNWTRRYMDDLFVPNAIGTLLTLARGCWPICSSPAQSMTVRNRPCLAASFGPLFGPLLGGRSGRPSGA